MVSNALFAVFAAFFVLQASANVIPEKSLKSDGSYNVVINIINSVLEAADRVTNEIRNNSEAITVGMHELVLQEIHPTGEIVASDIDRLIENATNDDVIACLNVEKHKLAGFVDVAVEKATECVMPHFNTIPDQLEPIVSGLEKLVEQATELADTWENCENSAELCELSFCINTFRMLADIPSSNLGHAAKAVWNAEVEITQCLSTQVIGMEKELETLYEEAALCEKKFE